MHDPTLFKWRHFEADIILGAVRWYLRYALSYRDVEEIWRERGVWVDHTTVFRWVHRDAPNWTGGAGLICGRPMIHTALMEPTSRLKSSGTTSTGPWIPRARHSIFC
jgi:hypothetical protein